MRYEVYFGGFAHWCEAGNPYDAALQTLDACKEEWDTFPQAPFQVINLDNDSEETVGLAEALSIRYQASQPLPERVPSEAAELDMETQWIQEELSCLPSVPSLLP